MLSTRRSWQCLGAREQQHPQVQGQAGKLGLPAHRAGSSGRQGSAGGSRRSARCLRTSPSSSLPSPLEHRGAQSQRREGGLFCLLVRSQRSLGGSCKDTGHAVWRRGEVRCTIPSGTQMASLPLGALKLPPFLSTPHPACAQHCMAAQLFKEPCAV